jgi:hypothetical protein
MFRLAKWYLDLVAEDGTALITYAASLRWGAIRLQYASTFLSRPGTAPIERSQLTRVHPPDDTDDVLHLSLPGLGLSGEWFARRAANTEPQRFAFATSADVSSRTTRHRHRGVSAPAVVLFTAAPRNRSSPRAHASFGVWHRVLSARRRPASPSGKRQPPH